MPPLVKIYLYLLLLTSLMTSGCAALLVGSAAAGGYYVGQDQRSVGEIADDARITSAVKTALIRDKQIKALDINVDTERGAVNLYGRVPDSALIERAVAIAKTVKGVKSVKANLTVIKDDPAENTRSVSEIASDARITAAVKTALIRDEQISALDIDVDTLNGVVTLYGRVEREALIKRAITVCQSVKGVKSVKSNLSVIPD